MNGVEQDSSDSTHFHVSIKEPSCRSAPSDESHRYAQWPPVAQLSWVKLMASELQGVLSKAYPICRRHRSERLPLYTPNDRLCLYLSKSTLCSERHLSSRRSGSSRYRVLAPDRKGSSHLVAAHLPRSSQGKRRRIHGPRSSQAVSRTCPSKKLLRFLFP